jgi:hypothetical protein
MIQKILFTLSLCSLLLPLNGQIKGTVIDTESNPIPFANVAIYTLPDTTLITGTTTNEQGSFMLNTDNISSDAFYGYRSSVMNPNGSSPPRTDHLTAARHHHAGGGGGGRRPAPHQAP